jgi:hypothetical protein
VGSDGNCAAGTTCHYNDRELLEEAVDWSVMTAKMWSNTVEDGDRMRRRMAEFLVHRQFPIGCVREVVAKHPDVAERAKGTLK